MKITQIWEVEFKNSEKKYLVADGIDDATQRAIDWTQKQFDYLKKEMKDKFDENQIADDYSLQSVRLFVETDI